MSRDELVVGALVLDFAVLVTTHVTLVIGLATRAPRWRAPMALIVPPLAPFWGWRDLRRRSIVWVVSAAAYLVLRLLASR